MPTAYPRMLITRTPEVEQIIAAGKRRWPGRPASAVIVALAKEAAAAQPRSSLLATVNAPGPLTEDIIAAALDEQ